MPIAILSIASHPAVTTPDSAVAKVRGINGASMTHGDAHEHENDRAFLYQKSEKADIRGFPRFF